ncbi:hypothetical protein P12x_002614 [Tundrisphaera lichenicola]|uniref:hypothetical protein n=1 Tax=Tundrisphaera lichenicola TaxID=2029860 RepID=UPI003EBF476B
MTPTRRFGWSLVALLAFAGCEAGTTTTETSIPAAPGSPEATPAPSPEAPKDATEVTPLPVEPAKDEAPKGADASKLSEEELAEIKKLSPEDQAIALAQVTCPVSGDNLGEGGMGVPIKQVIDGKTFFICCAGCEKAVKSDPAAVLAKLKK